MRYGTKKLNLKALGGLVKGKGKWIVIAVLFLLGFVILVFRKRKTNDEEADKALPKMTEAQRNSFKSLALGLAHDLGTSTDYNWWDISRYYERDKRVYDKLKNMSIKDFEIVARLYNEAYTKGRELRADILKLLDNVYLDKLTTLFPRSLDGYSVKSAVAPTVEIVRDSQVAKTCC